MSNNNNFIDQPPLSFNPLNHPILFSFPKRLVEPPSWVGHIPFAMLLVELTQPKILVELGTHSGNSYCALCQAVQELSLDTKCYAVDTWIGDAHAGQYDMSVLVDLQKHHDSLYNRCSTLMQTTFDDAQSIFLDGSIDLLHIDGLHTYDAVKHDFEHWLPKLSSRAVVIFHDIDVRMLDFGVWKFWEEIKGNYPSFEFFHSHGLGVIAFGPEYPASLDIFFNPGSNPSTIRDFFHRMGLVLEKELANKALLVQLQGTVNHAEKALDHIQLMVTQCVEKDQAIKTLALKLDASDKSLQVANTRLAEMNSSKAWKFANAVGKLSTGLASKNSKGPLRSTTKPASEVHKPANDTNDQALVSNSIFFNPGWYLATYPDVALAQANPLRHYLLTGWQEGRDPSPNFRSTWYLENYPDACLSGMNPLLHYLKIGISLGYLPVPPEMANSEPVSEPTKQLETGLDLFDPAWYLIVNPDVASAGMDPYQHYINWGKSEGRLAHSLPLSPYRLASIEHVIQEQLDFLTIRASGLSRLDYFIPTMPGISPETAIRTYLRSWSAGINRRKLFPGFHPGIFQEESAQYSSGQDPLACYLRAGQPDGPWNYEVITSGEHAAVTQPGLRVALHIHAYYPDLLSEILNQLNGNLTRPDLLISIPNEIALQEITKITSGYTGVIRAIRQVPNRGRDIGPFLQAFRDEILHDYEIVGHLHTKKTAWIKSERWSTAWRQLLLTNLLGGENKMADTILAKMASDGKIGIVFPDDPNLVDWGQNFPFALIIADKLGIQHLPTNINFPAGTMFWARVEAISPLLNLNLALEDLPAEPLAMDGSSLHAIERLLPLVVIHNGFKMAVTNVKGVSR